MRNAILLLLVQRSKVCLVVTIHPQPKGSGILAPKLIKKYMIILYMHTDKLHEPYKLKPKIQSALIEITNMCNYRCSFCLYRLSKKKPSHFPATKLIEFIKDLDRLNVKELTITGEGEPTLHPEIRKILICAAKTKIKTCIQTNGTYGEKLRKVMLLPNEVHFNISFFTKEAFSKLNRGIKFCIPQVIENMKFIKAQEMRPKIVVIYIINKYNLHEIETIVDRLNDLGVDAVEFKACEVLHPLNDNLMLSKEDARSVALNLIRQIKYCRFENNILEISRDFTNSYIGKNIFKSSFSAKTSKPEPGSESDGVLRKEDLNACFNPLRYFYLLLNGDVYPCYWNHLLIEPIGNINEKNIIEILNSKHYRDIVNEHAFNFDINKPKWYKCATCPVKNVGNPITKIK